MNLKKHVFQYLTPGVALAFVLGSPLNAQEVSEAGPAETELPDLVVTEGEGDGYAVPMTASGTKTNTPRLENPMSVSVVTSEALKDRGVNDLGEALRYTAGAQAENYGFEPRTTFLRFRGFDAFENGLYRDGLKLSNPDFIIGYNVEPFGAERLEIPKGPASVLYGQAAPGGLVNYVSKRPTDEPLREVSAGVNNFGRVRGTFDFGGPLDADGVWTYRLTGLAAGGETQVDYIDNDRLYLAPAVTWRPREETSWTFLAHIQEDETKPSQRLPADGTLRDNPHGEIDTDTYLGEPDADAYERTEYAVASIFDHRFDEAWRFRQKTRYYHVEVDDRTIYATSVLPDQRTVTRSNYESFGDVDGVHVDNQVFWSTTTGEVAHEVLFGLDVQYVEGATQQYFGAAPNLDVFDPVYGTPFAAAPIFQDQDLTTRQIGVYLQDQVDLTDRLILVVGGRHDWARLETEDHLAGSETETDEEKFTGRAGLLYRAAEGVSPYVSYSTSWLPLVGTTPAGRPYDPETARQFEAGVKVEPKDVDGYASLAFFDLVREDYLTPDPVTFANVQEGEAQTQGIELEGSAGLDNGLRLLAAYTYFLKSEVTESSFAAEEGESLAYTPEHQGSLWAMYDFEGDTALDGLSLGGGLRYIGSTVGRLYASSNDQASVPDFWLVDATVGYEFGNTRIDLKVHNLTDKEYVASAFGSAGSLFATYGQRRTVSASVTYNW